MKKYILAKQLDKKYRALARQRYNAFGCNDKWYGVFRGYDGTRITLTQNELTRLQMYIKDNI